MAPHHLRETLRRLPRAPGVYIFRSRTGEAIYVGKATSLRDRVRSYFAPGAGDALPKVRRIAAEADQIEVRETGSELAALLLESRLIKRLVPRYNSQGRGYRSCVFIKVDVADPFPRVRATRRPEPDGALYLGPFASGQTVEAALELLHRLFPLRTCDEPIGLFRDRRPCVRGQIGRCGAPCAGLTDARAYGAVVDEAIRFLRGEPTGLVKRLEAEMTAAAERLEFERAARLRDDLEAVRAIVERQALLLEALARRCLVAVERGREAGAAELFLIRHGRLAGEARVGVGGRGPLGLIAELAALLDRYWPPSGAGARRQPPAGGAAAWAAGPAPGAGCGRARAEGPVAEGRAAAGSAAALALTAGSAIATASMSPEELDELLIVARWLRSVEPEWIVELSPERLADPAARSRLAGEIAVRVRRLAAPAGGAAPREPAGSRRGA